MAVSGFTQNNLKGITLVAENSKTPVSDASVYSADFAYSEISDENGFVSF